MECGLVLSSMSPWEYVPKEQGVRKAGGFACKFCEGFWKAKAGSSRVVQLYGRSGQTKVALQLILNEPPERLYQKTAWPTTSVWSPWVPAETRRLTSTTRSRNASASQCKMGWAESLT